MSAVRDDARPAVDETGLGHTRAATADESAGVAPIGAVIVWCGMRLTVRALRMPLWSDGGLLYVAACNDDGSTFLVRAGEEDGPADEDDDDAGELPDTCLAPDGHWYVITYGRARWEIHAQDCESCAGESA